MSTQRGSALVILMLFISGLAAVIAIGLPLILTRRADVEQSFLRDLARDGAASMLAYARSLPNPEGGFTIGLSPSGADGRGVPTVNTVISGQVTARDAMVVIDGTVTIGTPHADCISRVAIRLHATSRAVLAYDVGEVICKRPEWARQGE
ncbi:MAG: hypothetical protein IV100_22840 [Myxococcales bacterium]|nr:hypothetical protein [Myxococcales bacterium]